MTERILSESNQSLFQIIIEEIFKEHSVMSNLNMNILNKKIIVVKELDFKSCLYSVILQILTIFSSIVSWLISYHLLKSGSYFLILWIGNIEVLICWHILVNLFNKTYRKQISLSNDLYITWRLWLSYIILTIAYGLDFMTFTKKSAGSEFMQFSQVLLLPIMLILMHSIYDIKLKKWIFISIFLATIWKMISLFSDSEFKLSFYLSICCFIYSFIHCYYLMLVKVFLTQGSIVQLIYYQSVVSVFFLPFVILLNDQFKLPILSIEIVFWSFLSAIFKLINLFINFLLLKKTDLLINSAVLNVPFLANDLIKALVYKLDCHISATRVGIIFLWDWISFNFAIKKVQ